MNLSPWKSTKDYFRCQNSFIFLLNLNCLVLHNLLFLKIYGFLKRKMCGQLKSGYLLILLEFHLFLPKYERWHSIQNAKTSKDSSSVSFLVHYSVFWVSNVSIVLYLICPRMIPVLEIRNTDREKLRHPISY